MKAKYILVIAATLLFSGFKSSAQVTSSATQPTTSALNNGMINIAGVSITTAFQVSFKIDGNFQPALPIMSDGTGHLTIGALHPGIYSDVVLTAGAAQTLVPGTFSIARIANQDVKFLAAAYENFAGVQDDDPDGYTQVYARLSQPLNKGQGIDYNANWCQRLIPVRNLFFQLTYGSTDNFKMYSFDTLNSKYVNRLDLLAHATLDADLELNILTLILPQNWQDNSGDMAHIYLDAMASLLSTTVTDSLKSNNPITTKDYNVHSLLAGFDLAGNFKNVWGSNFNIEVGPKIYWIFPASSTFNPRLNPQNENVQDIYSAQNKGRDFQRISICPYVDMEALIEYNTSGASSNNNSNVFLHYSYISNLAKVFGKNFPNSYFQFQIGYALDITKIFKPQS